MTGATVRRPVAAGVSRLLAAACVGAGLLAGAAAPAAGQGAGSGATTLLRVAPGPRPLALGNAYAAERDLLAMEYNPAALEVGEVSAAYQALPVGASAGSVAAAGTLAGLRVGASIRYLDYGHVDVIEGQGPVGRPTGATASGGELSALVAAAFPVGPVRLGVAARWLRQDVAGLQDGTGSVDAGVLVPVTRWLDAGIAVQHLGPDLEAGRAAPLPRTVRAGATVRGTVWGLDARVLAEARTREARTGAGLGLELIRGWAGGEAGLRLGWETRPAPGDAFSPLVVGGSVRLGPLGVELAWRALGPLGSIRQLGLRYRL